MVILCALLVDKHGSTSNAICESIYVQKASKQDKKSLNDLAPIPSTCKLKQENLAYPARESSPLEVR